MTGREDRRGKQSATVVRPPSGWKALLDALLPQTCLACGVQVRSGQPGLCPACATAFEATRSSPYCPRCGRTMPPASVHGSQCARCEHEGFWRTAGMARVGDYAPLLRRLVLDLKYTGRTLIADFLGARLAEELVRRGWKDELEGLVPVPMTYLRRWQRPCDHARLLADAVGTHAGLPVRPVVRRIRHTPTQTGLTSRTARFENVKGSFALRKYADVKGRCLCIVDNLLASGATATEMARVLRGGGAAKVYVAVVSRTVLAGDVQGRAPGPPDTAETQSAPAYVART